MQKTLDISLNSDGLVVMSISGDIMDPQMKSFSDSLAEGAEVIQNIYKKQGKKVKVLLDVSGFTGNYTPEALSQLAVFAKNNRLFVEKSASFGGSDKVKVAGELATALSGRENIMLFDTKEEALAWLSS